MTATRGTKQIALVRQKQSDAPKSWNNKTQNVRYKSTSRIFHQFFFFLIWMDGWTNCHVRTADSTGPGIGFQFLCFRPPFSIVAPLFHSRMSPFRCVSPRSHCFRIDALPRYGTKQRFSLRIAPYNTSTSTRPSDRRPRIRAGEMDNRSFHLISCETSMARDGIIIHASRRTEGMLSRKGHPSVKGREGERKRASVNEGDNG